MAKQTTKAAGLCLKVSKVPATTQSMSVVPKKPISWMGFRPMYSIVRMDAQYPGKNPAQVMMRFLWRRDSRREMSLGWLTDRKRCSYSPDSIAVQIIPVASGLVVADRSEHN